MVFFEFRLLKERENKMTEEERKSEMEKLRAKLAAAKQLVQECEQISERTGQGFSWNLAYGMGGYYQPNSVPDDGESGWQSSSDSC